MASARPASPPALTLDDVGRLEAEYADEFALAEARAPTATGEVAEFCATLLAYKRQLTDAKVALASNDPEASRSCARGFRSVATRAQRVATRLDRVARVAATVTVARPREHRPRRAAKRAAGVRSGCDPGDPDPASSSPSDTGRLMIGSAA